MRWIVITLLLARAASADPIAERAHEASTLERRGDFPALQRATALRAALGQRAKWIVDVERAVRLAPQTSDAAALVFELALVSPPHLRVYVDRFVGLGGPERAVIAHALLGEQLWTASCPRTIDGLCLRIDRPAPNACDQRRRWTFIARDGRVRAAVRSLELAVAMFEQGALTRADARAAYATAKRLLADHAFERSAAVPLPKLDLKFPGASKRSAERFNKWLDARVKGAGAVVRKYAEVFALEDQRATFGAALRVGQLSQALAIELVTAPLPHRMDQGKLGAETRDAYCERLREFVEPLWLRALEGFYVCVNKANELAVRDPVIEACWREIERARPEEFPPFRELVARPGAVTGP